LIELQQFVASVHDDLESVHQQFKETVDNINREFNSVDSIFAKHRQQKKLYLELRSQLQEMKKECGVLPGMAEIEDTLSKMKDTVGIIGKSKRKTGSLFVSMIMGAVNCRIWNEGDRFKFKSEYNRFKERWMSIFFVFPLLQILFPWTESPLWQLQSLLFFFYYSSLAIRENILSLNGSRIEPWWIYHHYWSMLIAVLSLSRGELGNIQYLNYFFLWQGMVMLLQNDYQKTRHYARKAMAKKGRLDIRTSEVIDETPHSRYKMLIPALYLTYFVQLMISIYFLFLSMRAPSNMVSVQILLGSTAWFVLSIGNTMTLSRVLQKKKRLAASQNMKQRIPPSVPDAQTLNFANSTLLSPRS